MPHQDARSYQPTTSHAVVDIPFGVEPYWIWGKENENSKQNTVEEGTFFLLLFGLVTLEEKWRGIRKNLLPHNHTRLQMCTSGCISFFTYKSSSKQRRTGGRWSAREFGLTLVIRKKRLYSNSWTKIIFSDVLVSDENWLQRFHLNQKYKAYSVVQIKS